VVRDKRRRILETAEEEFLLKGYDGTSIDAIVREVGGSKSTVYAHFPDKAVLFAEVLSEVRRELDFSLPRHRTEAAEGPAERLHLAVIELLSTLYRERALHLTRLLTAESPRFPEVARQYWEEGPTVAIDVLADRIRELPGPNAVAEPADAATEWAAAAASRILDGLMGSRYLRTLLGIVDPPAPAEFPAIAAETIKAVLGYPPA
jgi:TetR/AcrR family transcriptional regulator, mexJK operon transcriptional repressor